jgi:hypothetical protein
MAQNTGALPTYMLCSQTIFTGATSAAEIYTWFLEKFLTIGSTVTGLGSGNVGFATIILMLSLNKVTLRANSSTL